jgi:archaellum component FlaD/FlaE
MAVNQSQVDHIITAASEDDPEVKLQNLEREVDLIKTSIKRLLIDIRERMNELENPFTLVAPGTAGAPAGPSAADIEAETAKKSALEKRESALEEREARLDTQAKRETGTRKENIPAQPEPVTPSAEDTKRIVDEQILQIMRSQQGMPSKPVYVPSSASEPPSEKLRLQKVYKLFKWTRQAVKKVGHDRLEIILESYRAMGFISRESCDEIREISRLMPANLGEDHEVGPDEFITELYALNRILAPNDTSMDRDMIEVLMEQRQEAPGTQEMSGERSIDLPRISLGGKKSPIQKENGEEWMNLPDRI